MAAETASAHASQRIWTQGPPIPWEKHRARGSEPHPCHHSTENLLRLVVNPLPRAAPAARQPAAGQIAANPPRPAASQPILLQWCDSRCCSALAACLRPPLQKRAWRRLQAPPRGLKSTMTPRPDWLLAHRRPAGPPSCCQSNYLACHEQWFELLRVLLPLPTPSTSLKTTPSFALPATGLRGPGQADFCPRFA